MTRTGNKIIYYTGFNDGVYACHAAITTLVKQVEATTDPNQIKLMVCRTAQVVAEIMDQTSHNVTELSKLKEEQHGME